MKYITFGLLVDFESEFQVMVIARKKIIKNFNLK